MQKNKTQDIDFKNVKKINDIILVDIQQKKNDQLNLVYSHNLKCKRPYNEDRGLVYVRKDLQVYAVFDGHGGDQTAQFVRDYFYMFFNEMKSDMMKQLIQFTKTSQIVGFIQPQIDKIHQFICDTPKHFKQSGSTINMTICLSELFFCINLGDSRCIGLQKKKHKIEQLTNDHKPYSPLEQNENWKHEDDRVDGVLAMSRSIGDCSLNISRKADFYKYLRKNYYMIHLASDGIYDVLDNQEVFERILQNLDKDNSSKQNPLVQLFELKKKEMEDNCTSILVIMYDKEK